MNTKIILFINQLYLSKAHKIIKSFNELNIDNFLFICIDEYSYQNLYTDHKILNNIVFENSWVGKKKLWIKRIEILCDIIHKNNFDIIHCDADTEWLKNPLCLFDDKNINMYFTPGLNYPDQIFNLWGFVVRGGFYYLRNNHFVKNFMNQWVRYVYEYLDDQIALNMLLKDLGITWNIPDQREYVFNYIHSNNRKYNIMYCKDLIHGQIDDYRVAVLSSFNFPRLKTDNEAYVLDLYNDSKYTLSCIDKVQ